MPILIVPQTTIPSMRLVFRVVFDVQSSVPLFFRTHQNTTKTVNNRQLSHLQSQQHLYHKQLLLHVLIKHLHQTL